MNDRYEVFATHGKGVFSTVLRARDKKPVDEKGNPVPVVGNAYPEVAIKVPPPPSLSPPWGALFYPFSQK